MAAAAKSADPFAPLEALEDVNSVPLFTAEDEQRERQSLTEEERKRIAADLCGIGTGMAGLTISSSQPTAEIERGMNLLNAELGAIPDQEKEAYLLAMLQCPDQVFGGWRGEVILEMQGEGMFNAKVCLYTYSSIRMCDI